MPGTACGNVANVNVDRELIVGRVFEAVGSAACANGAKPAKAAMNSKVREEATPRKPRRCGGRWDKRPGSSTRPI